MEGHFISKTASKVHSKFEQRALKLVNETDEVTTLLEDKVCLYFVYDTTLGKNAPVPSIGTPSTLFKIYLELCTILQRR